MGYSPGGHKELDMTEHTDLLSLWLYFLDSFGNYGREDPFFIL